MSMLEKFYLLGAIPEALKSRIDGIYTSVPSAAKTFTVTPLFIDTGRRFSDHSLVISDFAFERAPKPNRFLLTPEILGDEEFQEFTNQALDSLLVKPTTSLSDWISCKKEILSFAKRVDRKLKKRVHCWIRINQRLLTTCILSADTCSYIRGLIPQVNDIITSLLVARVKHSYEHFKIDKVYAPRKFDAKFFGKLISTKKRNFIPSLSATNGDVITDAKEVSEEFYRHFSSFFSSSPVEEDLWGHLSQHVERVFLHPVPPLFSEEAVLDAISSINLGRSPGPDAIPAAFYRAFSSKLTPLLARVFSSLCPSDPSVSKFNLGRITVIPKKEDCTSISDFRSLTLTNVDYKVYARLLYSKLAYSVPLPLCPLKREVFQKGTFWII